MWKEIAVSIFVFTNIICALPQLGQEIHTSNSGYVATTPIPIVNQYSTSDPNGNFNISYETGNGIKVQNSGYIKKIIVPRHEDENGKIIEEHEENILVQSGVYSYTDPEGNLITLSYVADENGFQPIGDHIPQPPQVIHQQHNHEERPIIHQTPQNQLSQDVSNVPSQNFLQLNQGRPVPQQFDTRQEFQQFSQPQFNQRRFRRQTELNQERSIQQSGGYQEIPQERPIYQGDYKEIPQERPIQQEEEHHNIPQERPIQQFEKQKRFTRQVLHQERPIQQRGPQEIPHQGSYQDIPQERPIQQKGYQNIPQERPIQQYQKRFARQVLHQERTIEQGRHQEILQERPIQTSPGQPLNQERKIQSYPGQSLHQERPIQSYPGQELHQERPIQTNPGQPLYQERPIQPYPGQSLNQERPIQPYPGQPLYQERPIQQYPGQPLNQERPIKTF